MSQAPKPAKKGARPKKSEVSVPDEEKFDVGRYIDRFEQLDQAVLALDKPLSDKSFGQVREISPRHVLELVESYKRNPPVQLDLTVYQDPGVFVVACTVFLLPLFLQCLRCTSCSADNTSFVLLKSLPTRWSTRDYLCLSACGSSGAR